MPEFKVSVIIPFYNARGYVTQAVESAIDQPETGEVLLIEDGSPDGGIDICLTLAEKYPKVKLLRHADGKNHGAAISRNLGIKYSSFPYIAFLDADDYYLPGRFELTCSLFQKFSTIDGVYNAMGVLFESEKDRQQFQRTSLKELTTVKKKVDPAILFNEMIKIKGDIGYFHLNSLTIKKDLLFRVGLFNENLKMHEDTDLMLKVTAVGILIPGDLKNPVSVRRVHGGNRITYHMLDKRKIYETELFAYFELLDWTKENLDQRKQGLVAMRVVERLRKADIFEDHKNSDFLYSRMRMFHVAGKYPQLFLNYWFWRMMLPSKRILGRIN